LGLDVWHSHTALLSLHYPGWTFAPPA